MGNNNEAQLTYDKVVQFLAPLAWIVLGLLGWSLDSQVRDFKEKITSVEDNVGRLAEQHTSLVTDVAEFKVRQENVQERLGELTTQGRERSNQIERMSVVVNELLEIRREERRDRKAAAYDSGKHNPGD